uniref:RNA helicase n=1 Tax=Magallana gigas TaxID=29159 RepID=A0A8W8K352_MAGGI|nr:probable ATP-dependent RNA helicase DHX37 [Crassostrea gigas]
MGKRKHGFNWKARQQKETNVDRSAEKKIKLDIEDKEKFGYDDSNALVLPSEKRSAKLKQETDGPTVKKLSKKERKRLQKIIEQKEKKNKRASLLESLSAVQATSEELKHLASIAELQTGKFKKKLLSKTDDEERPRNAVAGSNKKKHSVESDDGDISEDSDSSIHTSDMSSDEEEEKEVVQEEDQHTSSKTLEEEEDIKSKKPETDSGCDEKLSEDSETIKSGDISVTRAEKKVMEHNPVLNIPVNRKADVQEARLKLPILAEEQIIMETINENSVTIICGETGSGKTTQVPQFLYEAGYAQGDGIIAVTEPRRVAAISMSYRVATEMNLSSREISYQIRYEGNVTENTKIKFMTDGVLLKEVQKDFLLTKYSVVIIDEAHERSVYTDILIGLLSRIVPLRHKKGNPLKLIIMSATLRVEDFTENRRLFKIVPPVVKVDSRQFPVTIHFNKRTPMEGFLNEAYKKVCKIHKMLPSGGILVFVTGQQEVYTLCKKLKNTFPDNRGQKEHPKEKTKKGRRRKSDKKKEDVMPSINLDNYSVDPIDEEEEREAGEDSDFELLDDIDLDDSVQMSSDEEGQSKQVCTEPLYVLPLFSLLSTEKQAKVFAPPPEGCRLCVIATNVAETSLTIPNIKYVVDTGKVKTKFYDKVTGVSTFKIIWTSKAAANQRAGRAGRVAPGHCYRLYSSAVFNEDFEKFSPAEITRRPVDDLILQMKDMNIEKVVNFPYPTPPDIEQIKAAENLLISLGALAVEQVPRPLSRRGRRKPPDVVSRITPLGRAMACFPVSPRYAKMLSLGHQQGLLPYVVAVVAALSVQEVFIEFHKSSEDKSEFQEKLKYMTQIKRMWAGSNHSLLLGDLMVLLKAVGACEYQGASPEFCEKHGIRYKAMKEIRKLRAQLTNAVNTVIDNANLCVDPKLDPPNDLQAKLLRQIVLAGLADHVAKKCPDPAPNADEEAKKLKHAYFCTELEEPVFIHPLSVLYKQKPEYIVYQYIQETSKVYMKGISAIEPEWLPVFAPYYCTFSKPLESPEPSYSSSKGQVVCHMTCTFSRCSWPVPPVELEYPEGLDRYRWFARFLLEGKVVPKLKQFGNDLLSTPVTMIKSWAKLQPRTEVLLKALVSKGVDNRDSLLKAWKTDSTYLLSEYSQWLPLSKHDDLKDCWPPAT